MVELRGMPTPIDLKHMPPHPIGVAAVDTGIAIKFENMIAATRNLQMVFVNIAVSVKQLQRSIRSIMRQLYSLGNNCHSKGYVIVNKRGRNKLVDIRRHRK